LLELLRGPPSRGLGRGGVARSEVRHDVSVPPTSRRARLLPRLRLRELDHPAESLALRMCDAQQTFPTDRHARVPSCVRGSDRSGGANRGEVYSRAMRVLVCPDKFRGTLSAREAAEAIARGWRRARSQDELDLVPLADGGEGTLDVLVPLDPSSTSRRISAKVTGPRGDPVEASAGVVDGAGVVEMARASGLQLLTETRRDPRPATTRGTRALRGTRLGQGGD